VIKGRCWAIAQTLKVNPIARAKAARIIVFKEEFIADRNLKGKQNLRILV
jgi:hypothetical protein